MLSSIISGSHIRFVNVYLFMFYCGVDYCKQSFSEYSCSNNIRIWLIMGLDAQNRCVLDDKDVENPCEDEASMWCEGANGVNSDIKS